MVRGKTAWVVAGVGAALVVASVVWALLSDTVIDGLRRDTTQQASYAMPADGLTVLGGADDVSVVTGGAAAGVLVTRHLTWSPWSPAPTAFERLNGSTLELRADCGGILGWCDVDYVVTVPEGSDLTVDNESGDVTVTGAFGSTVLKTASGDIATTRLQANELTAYADSGDIELGLGAVVPAVDVRAGSGDVSVTLPKDARYALSLDTGAGEQDIEVATDPAGSSSMQVKTGSGDVAVTYR